MKKIVPFLITIFIFFSCETDDDKGVSLVNATFSFAHNWDGTLVTNSNFNAIQYTNANGEQMSIEKLRYLISKITFTKSAGENLILSGYNLVDVTNNTNLSYTPINTIPLGNYSNVKFTFGFDNDDNYNGNYTDLNSAIMERPRNAWRWLPLHAIRRQVY